MGSRATATYTVDAWDEEPCDDHEGGRLVRTRVSKTFHGDIEGVSVADSIMAHPPVEGAGAYVGMERIVGRLHGREGSFVIQHCASMSPREQAGSWRVVWGTGTGELVGLSGQGEMFDGPDGAKGFALDYEISSE
jgi:hypothetical protein